MRQLRHIFAGAALVLAVVLAAGAVPGVAQTPAPYVHVYVDGQLVAFDVPPQIQNSRVLVPLRGVFERLGASVGWDDRTQTVLAERGATSVALVIGQTQATVNGQPAAMDVPAMLVGGRTMVPLRFVSQALGASVNWDASTYTVTIASSGTAAAPPPQTYPPAPQSQHVVGTLVGVKLPGANSPGQIAVSHDGTVSTYLITPTTAITRVNAANGTGGSVDIASLKAGDAVDVIVGQNNAAMRISATYYSQ
ncbi:MAG TPA: copper amine oxidase N-terminal domain-containing protein [bacterium]|nr:copper amine oxidase N-terminal domain-containing protein [bacterium]